MVTLACIHVVKYLLIISNGVVWIKWVNPSLILNVAFAKTMKMLILCVQIRHIKSIKRYTLHRMCPGTSKHVSSSGTWEWFLDWGCWEANEYYCLSPPITKVFLRFLKYSNFWGCNTPAASQRPDPDILILFPLRIQFKVLTLVFKCLYGNAPAYLGELTKQYQPGRNLRSQSKIFSLKYVWNPRHLVIELLKKWHQNYGITSPKTLDPTGVATEDYLLLVGGMRQSLIPPLTINNPPWLRPWIHYRLW